MGVGHEPLINFFKILRSHSSLNAKFHTLNDIEIFFKKYHWEANIIFYNFFLTPSWNSHGIYTFRGLLSSTWVKNQVFIVKFGQKVYPPSWNHPYTNMGLWHICKFYVHKYFRYSTGHYALVVSLECLCGHDEVYMKWGISAMGMGLTLNKQISYINSHNW